MHGFDKTLRALVGQYALPPVDPEAVEPGTLLIEDLGIDSLQMIRLLVEVEAVFGVALGEEYLTPEAFRTYAGVQDMVAASLQGAVRGER